jgi:RNA polymerase sigma factor (sigma-70 family)
LYCASAWASVPSCAKLLDASSNSLLSNADGGQDTHLCADDADDRNPYLEDDTYNPLQQILTSIANEERSVRMEKMKVALSELTDKQKDTVIKKFYRGMTNVQIAAEEGVSEAAIRNRLTKIYATLKKKI